MRLCLVAPPTLEFFDEGPLVQSRGSREAFESVPLGVLSLAAVLEQRGLRPNVIDLNRKFSRECWPDPLYFRQADFFGLAMAELSKLECDVFGLSTMCSTYPLTLRIARELKRLRPELVIILGGPQASVVDRASLEAFSFVDFILRGEAEHTLPRLLHALDTATDFSQIPGLTFRRSRGIIRNPNAAAIQDLDSLPLPAFHLCSRIEEFPKIALEIGRGCPFACTFCSTNDFFRRRFRLKSPERTISQMCAIEAAYGIRCFELVHDMFTVDRRKVVEFCDAMIASGRNFVWNCSARTDCVDEELLQHMAAAGCSGIFFGIETGSARMQKIINKNLDMDQAAKVIQSTAQANLGITLAFIDGFPEEEKDDLKATVDFLVGAARFDHVSPQISILAPLAETPLHTLYRERLVLDTIVSGMSHQGWRQDLADLELISAHPDIFPNFYGLPCPVGRHYVHELNGFVISGLARFRWLLIALCQSGSLLDVFDQWLSYRGPREDIDRYYASVDFVSDFNLYLRKVHLRKKTAADRRALIALLDYYDALDAALTSKSCDPFVPSIPPSELLPDTVPRLADGVQILQLEVDVQQLISRLRSRRPLPRDLRKPTTLATRPSSGGQIDILTIPAFSAAILQLCNGRLKVRSIVRQLRNKKFANGHNGDALYLEGLSALQQSSLIQCHGPDEDIGSTSRPA